MPDEVGVVDLGPVVSVEELIRQEVDCIYRRTANKYAIRLVKVKDKDGVNEVTIPFLETDRSDPNNVGEKDNRILQIVDLVENFGYPLLLATRMVYDKPGLIDKAKLRKKNSPVYLVGIVGRPHVGKTTIANNSGMDVVNLDPFSNHESDTSLGRRLDKLIEEIARGAIETDLLMVDLPGKGDSRMEFDVYDDLAQAMDITISPDQERIDFSKDKYIWDKNKLIKDAGEWRNFIVAMLKL